jgi:hypothetical protein
MKRVSPFQGSRFVRPPVPGALPRAITLRALGPAEQSKRWDELKATRRLAGQSTPTTHRPQGGSYSTLAHTLR